jgi:selenocysteine-specific elongation factor
MTAPVRPVRHVILGTAGHIDHGKTTLVERLTGTWADRLPEERERGMTIDLGYAAFELADGTEVGLLDVPGHENFVHTMVAGATAMDLALLVVAADDGPMLQTREHVQILDILGVTRLVVALTKIDLVDADTVDLAEEEVRELIDGTGMRGAPIVRMSSATGEGLDTLRATLQEALPRTPAHRDDGRVFRMPVLRGFLVPGRGAVVTGIPISGRLTDGERIEILPPQWKGRVRGIQVHGHDAQEASIGHRAALAVSDIEVESLKRGMVVVGAGVIQPATRLVVEARVLADARNPLEHGDRVRLHVGAARVVAQVHLPARKPIPPGGKAIVELVAVTPVVALPGDRLVLRTENASATLGGGVVIDLPDRPLPKRREGLLERIAARVPTLGRPEALVGGILESAGEGGLDIGHLAARSGLRPEGLPGLLASLAAKGKATPIGRTDRWSDAEAFSRVLERVEESVRKLHAKDPGVAAWPLSTVRAAHARMEPAVLEAALATLVEKDRLDRTADGGIRHIEHSDELPARDRALCEAIQALLARGAGQPPDEDELSAGAGASLPDIRRALRLLASRGRIFRGGDHWFDGPWIEEAKARLTAFAAEHGGFTPSDARTLLDTTRKWIIPLLEALDKTGFSRRTGDRRVVRAPG